MRKTFFRPPPALGLILVLIAVIALSAPVMAGEQDPPEKTNSCGNDVTASGTSETAEAVKLDTVLGHPEDYFGKTVTVEGEMHRIFSDHVFSIEDDDFFKDDDLLIISVAPKSKVLVALEDSKDDGECGACEAYADDTSLDPGKDVRVTGVIQPFNRSAMECRYGPLQIESRESHYKEGSPVMIIELPRVATFETRLEAPVILEKPSPAPEPPPEPVYEPLPELPKTASGVPLIGLAGMLALCASYCVARRRQRQ